MNSPVGDKLIEILVKEIRGCIPDDVNIFMNTHDCSFSNWISIALNGHSPTYCRIRIKECAIIEIMPGILKGNTPEGLKMEKSSTNFDIHDQNSFNMENVCKAINIYRKYAVKSNNDLYSDVRYT